MKCQKCGFVSFDHLSECTKCGSDLRAVREGLGFTALKSEVPSLLGSLLGSAGEKDGTLGKSGGEVDVAMDVDSGSPDGPRSHTDQNSGFPAPAPKTGKPAPEKAGSGMMIELSEADFEDLPEMGKTQGEKEHR